MLTGFYSDVQLWQVVKAEQFPRTQRSLTSMPFASPMALSDWTISRLQPRQQCISAESLGILGGNAPTGTVTKTIFTSTNLTDNNVNFNINNNNATTPTVQVLTPITTSGTSYSIPAHLPIMALTYTVEGSPISAPTPTFSAQSGNRSAIADHLGLNPGIDDLLHDGWKHAKRLQARSPYQVPLYIEKNADRQGHCRGCGILLIPPLGQLLYTITPPTIRVSLMRNASSRDQRHADALG